MLVMVGFLIEFRWLHLSTPLFRLVLLAQILLLLPALNFLPVWLALCVVGSAMGVIRPSGHLTTGASCDAGDFVAGWQNCSSVPTTRKIARTGQRLSTQACSALPGGAEDAQSASQGQWMSVIVASISWFVGLLNCLRHVQISPFSLNFKLIENDVFPQQKLL